MLVVKETRRDEAQKAEGRTASREWLLWLVAILASTFVVYLPSLQNGFVSWDDNYYVIKNHLLPHPTIWALLTTPLQGNYHPLTMASLALNYRISGLHPASYHWVNLLLHLANTGLVFAFVRKLSGGRRWTTVVTALFFGIHPMHVESVAWISERKDVLYAFFYLIALIAYLKHLETRRPIWLAATGLAFLSSVASKPAAVVLPLSLVAIDYYRRRPVSALVVLEKVPFFAVSLVAGVLTFRAQTVVGAVAAPTLWSPIQRTLLASYCTVTYVAKLFVPVHLSAIYPLPSPALGLPAEYSMAPIDLAVLLAVIVYLSRRSRPVLFGLAFFFINIVLVLQFVTVGTALIADRYTYIPYIGLFFALAGWLDEPSGSTPAYLRPLVAGVVFLLLPVSLVQTWKRCHVWQNPETFWNDTIEKYPRQIVNAYFNRGNYYMKAGRVDEALADYDEALALNPYSGATWFNKGLLLAQLGRDDSAIACFDRVLELTPTEPEAMNNRGGMKYRKGDLAGAVADFSRAVELNPKHRDAHLNRAAAYFDMGEYEKSIDDRRQGIELEPENLENHQEFASIAEALQRLNRNREAIAALDRAIQTASPGNEHIGGYYLDRSHVWLVLHDRAKALSDAREAVRLGANVEPAYRRELGL